MWILVAEAMGALGLFLFIVWWTFGPTQRRERDALTRRMLDDDQRRAAGSRVAPPAAGSRDVAIGEGEHGRAGERGADVPDRRG